MSLQKCLDDLIGREGGYSNHPSDRGGPTRWGITQAIARAYGYHGDMRTLPRVTAEEIYKRRYWQDPKFDEVGLIYPKVAEELLDTGVNMGQAVAAKFLQRALNVLNRAGRDYPDINADGQIGRLTLAALAHFKNKRGAEGEAVLLKALDGLQAARYIELAEKRQKNEDFVYGWLRTRVGELA